MYTKLLKYQRENRKNMPPPERILWHKIRSEQLGIKFRRQYALRFSSPLLQEGVHSRVRIFDFYAPQINLAIELDGDSHFPDQQSRDRELQLDHYLFEKYNIKVIRFLNPDVMYKTIEVLEEIVRVINSIPHPNLPPF